MFFVIGALLTPVAGVLLYLGWRQVMALPADHGEAFRPSEIPRISSPLRRSFNPRPRVRRPPEVGEAETYRARRARDGTKPRWDPYAFEQTTAGRARQRHTRAVEKPKQ